jgi:hypothetical protein
MGYGVSLDPLAYSRLFGRNEAVMMGSYARAVHPEGLTEKQIKEQAARETAVQPQAGKRQYLGIICHNLDDLPVMIDDDVRKVRYYLETLNVDVISDQVSDILELDGSTTPNAAKIVTFENGKPVSSEIVRNFIDEETLAMERGQAETMRAAREQSPDLAD